MAASNASAQQIVTSQAPDTVGVTIYRAPNRGPDDDMDLDWLRGYALITETRTVTIPEGKSILRFEGVAAGMLPESVIVAGLPGSVREKNLDADLLSPGNLFARSYGRPVTLRRMDPKSGVVREEPAIIRSGPDGAAILQTRAGFEAANCSGMQDELVFPELPARLTAKPTLLVETDASAPSQVKLSLSYLAWGFDWQTNYVFRMQDDGRRADVLAWVTLANSDITSFSDAETSVVGGEVNREDQRDYSRDHGEQLTFQCFFRPVVDPMAPPAPMVLQGMGDIIVTARRREDKVMSAPLAVTAIEEGLGDLRLYRIPVPTTVASNSQKQVAMFEAPDVKMQTYYASNIEGGDAEDVRQRLRLQNRKADGLGRALPAGQIVVFQNFSGEPILTGEGVLSDSAIGQQIEIDLGSAMQVQIETTEIAHEQDFDEYQAIVTNANAWPVSFEARISVPEDQKFEKISGRIEARDGQPLWRVRLPANGAAQLRYRLRDIPETGSD